MTETLEVVLPQGLESPLIDSVHGLGTEVSDLSSFTRGKDIIPILQRNSTVMTFILEPEQRYYTEVLKNLAYKRSKILTRLRIFPWFADRVRRELISVEQEINAHLFLMADMRGSDPSSRLTTAKKIMEKCDDLIAEIEEKLR